MLKPFRAILASFVALSFALALGFSTRAALSTPASPAPSPPAAPQAVQPIVDLHAHIFFYEGMGTSLLGGFNSQNLSRDWTDIFEPRVNAKALEDSGARIIVVALYAHPLFLFSEKDSIRKQIHAAVDFVNTHPNWAIAKNAKEASELLHSGKRIFVLSLEGASGVLENEADLEEFVDHLGIRIVTLVHFTDDRFGGACLMPGMESISNPWAAIKSIFAPHRDRLGVATNPEGLTEDGKWLTRELLKRGVWIDLAHSSDATYQSLLPLLEAAHQPLLYTHTMLREHFRAERACTPERLEKVKVTQGIVGVLPSETMLGDMQAEPLFCPRACDGNCRHGIPIFLTHYSEISSLIHDPSSVMIGSDINAPLKFLGPACDAVEKKGDQGLSNYAELLELWKALRQFDLAPADPNAWVDRFLTTWDRVQPQIVPTTPTAKTTPGSG